MKLSYEITLSEVRRISAGGKPVNPTPPKRFLCSAEKLGWKANSDALRILAAREGR